MTTAGPVVPVVVAIVPAFERADSVAATVRSLLGLAAVNRVLVVDDGSSDATSELAWTAGAEVLRLPMNRGKAAAVRAGVEVSPDADIYLLVDADVAATASMAERLLAPVLDGDADMAVAVLPSAGSKGGFGLVRSFAAAGVARACGFRPSAPLSGQRAVRASLLRDLGSAERFGLEVAMTVDAVRAGARVVEIDVAMDHRHTGRRVSGFAHRARQGADIARALWPRITSPRLRIGAAVVVTIVVMAAMVWSGSNAEPSSVPAAGEADRVLVVGIPRLGLDDLGDGRLPNLSRLAAEGAMAATSVRTLSTRPSVVEAYATLGAGTRVKVSPSTAAEQAFQAGDPLEGGTAAEVVARRSGARPQGDVVVVGGPAAIRLAGDDLSSAPGALGDALERAGLRTAVVGAADFVDVNGTAVVRRPVAISLMDSAAAVDAGSVDGNRLLRAEPTAPYGLRADIDAVVEETTAALGRAQVVVVDPGDTDRAGQYASLSSSAEADDAREQALRWADDLVGRLSRQAPDGTLLLAIGVTPPTNEWALTPTIAWGAGVVPGYLHSSSTKRLGLVTLTDVAPTVLGALGAEASDGMIGAPFRYHGGEVDLARLRTQNDLANTRERVYFPMALQFIIVQALAYLLAILALSQGGGTTRIAPVLRVVVLAFAAWPLATFVYRAVPGTEAIGSAAQLVVWAMTLVIALVAARARRHALSGLAWIAGATAVLMLVDVATGARLQMSSILGYSPHTAARFTGFGNTAFAVLAATSLVAAAVHVQYAPRRREALVATGGFLLVVLVADSAPMLGADVGGVLTLVPVFGLTVYVLTGRRLSWRTVLAAGVGTVVVLGAFVAVDLLRSPEARTHIGNFASDVGKDDSTFLTTVSRKWSTNVAVFGKSIWTWMVPIITVFLVYVLVVARGWQRLLPPRSALRAGVVGVVIAGLIGWLVNDSGVVVSALVFVYLGPYLTLLALEQEGGQPVLLPAAAGEPVPPPALADVRP